MTSLHFPTLPHLSEAITKCTACPLAGHRRTPVVYRGAKRADLMFVGDVPGELEDVTSMAFSGLAGELLDNMIRSIGFEPSNVHIAHIIKCHTPQLAPADQGRDRRVPRVPRRADRPCATQGHCGVRCGSNANADRHESVSRGSWSMARLPQHRRDANPPPRPPFPQQRLETWFLARHTARGCQAWESDLMSDTNFVGIFYGRIFAWSGDEEVWDSLFEYEEGMTNAVLAIPEQFDDPKFDTSRDGEGKWMGFVVVASDLEGLHALGARALNIDAIRVPLRPQINDATARWKSLRSEMIEMYGIDIGEGRLFLASDWRQAPTVQFDSPLHHLRRKNFS